MRREFREGLAKLALLLGAGVCAVYAPAAAAQEPQDPQMFSMRMKARIETVQMRIASLENALTGGDADRHDTSEFEAGGGLLGQLRELDEQSQELKREVDSMGMRSVGFPSQVYEKQREMEYTVWSLEERVRQLRRWIRPAGDEPESSVEPPPEIDTHEDGISDEDWAADWARGDR